MVINSPRNHQHWSRVAAPATTYPTPDPQKPMRVTAPLPISGRFYKDLRRHLASYTGDRSIAFLFTAVTGKLMTATSFRSIHARAKKRAGVTGRLSPHYGRVWLITALAEERMSPRAIGKTLKG